MPAFINPKERSMSRFLMTTITVATLIVAAPAFAQMAPSGSMASPSMGSMNCQDMMNKANSSMGSMSDDSKKPMMMKEMGMAKTDMAANKEESCKMHMKKVMGMM
jgi:hypothetical protein